jgi:hypothetical protein
VEHYYRAVDGVRVADNVWSQVPDVVTRGLLSATLDQVGRSVGAAASGGGFDRHDALVTRRDLVLDERGFADLAAELRTFLERAREIEVRSAERLASTDSAGAVIDAGVVAMLFEGPAIPVDEDTPPRRR